MKVFKNLLFVVCLSLSFVCAQSRALAEVELQNPNSTPMELIKTVVDQLVEVVEKFPEEAQAETRRAELRKIIEPKFDFEEMAKRSLGANWLKINDDQRKHFVDVFSDLLARTYLERIEDVRAGMVEVNKEKVVEPKALVRTTVTYKGDDFPIDYKLLNEDGGWKVYDVVIENIGLVANYRNEFSGIIRKEKFAGLMSRLEKKMKADAS